jgi:hypothetical protein
VRFLGGKWRPSVGNVREWHVESQHLQSYSLRLCRLRTDVLVPASKYWTYQSHAGVYELSKPSIWLSIEGWLFSTASLAVLGEKLGTDPWIGQPSYCGLYREPFFSGAVDLLKSVDDFTKGCYMWIMWDTHGQGPYADRARKVCGVLVGFSSKEYTSIRITVTLGYK